MWDLFSWEINHESSPSKIKTKSPTFLEFIQGDICGLIYLLCRPFWYFMALIDASSRCSHVCLLSTRNVTFERFFAQIIRLRAQFSDYIIKKVRLDNASEFMSQTFNDYCMSIGIAVLSIVLPMYIHKMIWLNHWLSASSLLLDH